MSTSHEPQPTNHSAPGAHDAFKQAKAHAAFGLVLIICMSLSVFLSYVNFNKWFGNAHNWNFIVCMAISAAQASLVAFVFMHLRSERWTIYRFLLMTVVFLSGLFILSTIAFGDHIHQ
jgi:caa(3)-type oxidase subunit IV